MSSDWEDGNDLGQAPVSYTIPNIENMALILMGMEAEGAFEHEKRGVLVSFPASLQAMLQKAAESLVEQGCCKGRSGDSKTHGIANEIGARVCARTAKLSIGLTGCANDSVPFSSAVFSGVKAAISAPEEDEQELF